MSERIRPGNDPLNHGFRNSRRSLLTSCPELSPPISMLAPPCVGENLPLVPLICEVCLSPLDG